MESKRDYIVGILDTMSNEEILSVLVNFDLVNVRELATETIYSLSESSKEVEAIYKNLLSDDLESFVE